MTKSTSRLHELDSLRALAAFGVIGWHYTNHFQASPLAYLMQPFYRHGLLLVDFFFVLSGFVLARAYWTETRSASIGSNLRDRVARIYPLHFVTLCAAALMQWYLFHPLASQPFIYSFNDKFDFAVNALLLNRTGLERGFSFNAPSWSISTEFVVNVIFFVFIGMPKLVARVGLIALFVLSFGIVIKNGLISNATVFGGIDNDIFRTIVGFLAGTFAATINAKVLSRYKLKEPFADAVVLASVCGFLYYCARGDFSGYRDLAIALTLFPVLILGVIHGWAFKSMLRFAPLVYLGTISYSIYLVHYPLQLAIHVVSIATATKMPYANAFFFVGFMAAVVALASITYWLIELPGKRLLRSRARAYRTSTTV
jgi:peptidoglycan/LPS O-acetylase OafA/YrhL